MPNDKSDAGLSRNAHAIIEFQWLLDDLSIAQLPVSVTMELKSK